MKEKCQFANEKSIVKFPSSLLQISGSDELEKTYYQRTLCVEGLQLSFCTLFCSLANQFLLQEDVCLAKIQKFVNG